jgi:hypothetical protein
VIDFRGFDEKLETINIKRKKRARTGDCMDAFADNIEDFKTLFTGR